MRKTLFLIFLLLLIGNTLFSQTDTLVYWGFADSNRVADQCIPVNSNRIMKRQAGFTGSYYYDAGVTDVCLRTSSWSSGNGTKYWVAEFSSKTGPGTGYTSLKLSSRQKSTNTGPRDFRVEYSLDTLTWFAVPGSDIKSLNDNFISGTISILSLPAACDTQSVVYLRWIMTSDSNAASTGLTSTGYNRIDDISIVGQPFLLPADTTPPYVTNVLIKAADTVDVTFNEYLDAVSAENSANYMFAISAACDQSMLIADNKVRLHLSTPLQLNAPDTLIVDNIADSTGNIMADVQRIPLVYFVIDTVVYWGFADTNQTADAGIPVNLTKTLCRETSFSGTYAYDPGNTDLCLRTSSWASGNGAKYWMAEFSSSNGDGSGYVSLKLFSYQKSTNSGPRDFKVEFSLDTLTWTPIPGSEIKSLNDAFLSGTISGLSLPPACDKQEKVFLRWIMISDSNAAASGLVTTGYNRIDDVLITGIYVPDNIPPKVISVSTVLCDTVVVVYSEPVNATSLDIANYQLLSNTVEEILTGSQQNSIFLILTIPTVPGPDSLTISNVTDMSGNAISDTSLVIVCQVAGLDEIQNDESNISVFPNPFEDEVSVILKNCNENNAMEISLCNSLGKIIWTSGKVTGSITQKINLSDYSSGLYFMTVSVNGTLARYKKLVKIH